MTSAFIVIDLNDTNSYNNNVNVVGVYTTMLNAGKAKQRAMAKAIREGIEDNSTMKFFEKNLIIKEISMDIMP